MTRIAFSLAAPAALGAALAAATPETAAAQVAPWYLWHNQVAPTVTASSVSLDASGNFVYRYTVANGAAAQQRINMVHFDLAVPATGAGSPTDWEAVIGTSSVTWGASGTIDPTWQEAHDLDVPSFLSEIAPGASLAGFELQSACGASSTPLAYFIQGYNHIAKQPEDDESEWVRVPQWREDAVSGGVMGPGDCSGVADWGNRRPAVDGFLGLVNFAGGASLPAGPVTVQVRFSRSGETVNRATFSATLNSVDVTAAFATNASGDRVAVFALGSSSLRSGNNVLLLSVDGIVPGTTRTATDADRFTFTIP